MEKWTPWRVKDADICIRTEWWWRWWASLFQHFNDSDHAVIRLTKVNQNPFAAVFTRWCVFAPACINNDTRSFTSIRPFCCDRRLFPVGQIWKWWTGALGVTALAARAPATKPEYLLNHECCVILSLFIFYLWGLSLNSIFASSGISASRVQIEL